MSTLFDKSHIKDENIFVTHPVCI